MSLGLFSVAVALLAIVLLHSMFFSSKRFDPKGKFCYVTGGSAGLGKALSEELVRRGAHVVIVARDSVRASKTIEGLKTLAQSPDQTILYVSADLSDVDASNVALDTACDAFGGRAPDYTFLCAGFSKPQFFIDASSDDLRSGLDGVYWVSAWTAHAAVKKMVRQKTRGTIVFVSSFLGFTSFAGYSPYSPGKYALRGLADTLRSELQLHDIKVHLYMPAGILSPGYEIEQKTKPAITRKIEDGDTPITAEKAAAILVRGIEKGHYQISNDLITDLVRLQSRGAAPGNGLVDVVYWFIGGIGLPIWRMITDGQVRGARAEVQADLDARGFYS